jgi:hypothetical protein
VSSVIPRREKLGEGSKEVWRSGCGGKERGFEAAARTGGTLVIVAILVS